MLKTSRRKKNKEGVNGFGCEKDDPLLFCEAGSGPFPVKWTFRSFFVETKKGEKRAENVRDAHSSVV